MIFIYNAVSILLFGCIFRSRLNDGKGKKKYLILCFFQMFIIQGLRASSVGKDTFMYMEVYNRYLGHEYESFLFGHYELGFQALQNLLHYFNADSQILLILCSAITLVNIAIVIYKKSDDVVLSTWLFACMFYPNSFNIIRQYLAVSIALWSFVFMTEGNNIKAIIAVIIAFLFHTITLFFFIPIIIYRIKNWKLIRNVITVLAFFIVVFGNQVTSYFLKLSGKSFYLSSDSFGVSRLFRMTTFFTFVFFILLFIYMKKNEDDKIYNEMNLFYSVSFVVFVCGLLYLKFEFFSRVIELLNIFLLFAFPMSVTKISVKYKPLVSLGLFVVPMFLLINSIYNSGSGISEYSFFFEEVRY